MPKRVSSEMAERKVGTPVAFLLLGAEPSFFRQRASSFHGMLPHIIRNVGTGQKILRFILKAAKNVLRLLAIVGQGPKRVGFGVALLCVSFQLETSADVTPGLKYLQLSG